MYDGGEETGAGTMEQAGTTVLGAGGNGADGNTGGQGTVAGGNAEKWRNGGITGFRGRSLQAAAPMQTRQAFRKKREYDVCGQCSAAHRNHIQKKNSWLTTTI